MNTHKHTHYVRLYLEESTDEVMMGEGEIKVKGREGNVIKKEIVDSRLLHAYTP